MTYEQVKDIIISALTGRPVGSRVQEEDHEAAEIAILDYVEQLKNETTGAFIREAHAAATAGANCELVWSNPFPDTDYSFIVNGFDSKGNPVSIYKRGKSSTKLTVKTLVNAELYAMARPYGGVTS